MGFNPNVVKADTEATEHVAHVAQVEPWHGKATQQERDQYAADAAGEWSGHPRYDGEADQ